MSQSFDIPVLLIIFNRPEQTRKVFQSIRDVKPARLFVAADGARKGRETDAVNCRECREIVKQVDWDCEVSYLFREKNLGCKLAVSGAINWFFEQVTMGIILEDDCLAEQSFFLFCRDLLKRFEADSAVMHIGGTNFQPKHDAKKQSYYFSNIPHIWGWATWRRAWNCYDVTVSDFSTTGLKSIFRKAVFPRVSFSYWNHMLSLVQQNNLDTWDYQWTYAIWKNNGLVITPEQNMVSNIGFDNSATHTTAESPYANMPTFPIETIIHPAARQVDVNKDIYIFRHWFVKKTLRRKIWNVIKKYLFKPDGNEV